MMLLAGQTLLQGILWYVCAFIFTLAFIVCGCLLGAFARKKKDAKTVAEKTASEDNA